MAVRRSFATIRKQINGRFEKARAIVRTRIEVAQLKQAERYDSVHKDAIFHKNDLVLIYKPIRKKGRSEKLLHCWIYCNTANNSSEL